ncbi:MAG: response regulator [Nitrospirae bacterium]|nr:response regulator [Nitrospirota bacterium]MBF0592351.1 response regulator [Nitrospirota bacterium]
MLTERIASELEYHEDGLKNSLICDDHPDNQRLIAASLRQLNYNVQVAKDIDDVYDALKYQRFDIIVLNEEFAGGNSENNEVLDFLQTMPIAERRLIFVALVGNAYKSLDNMTAFAKSVNVVLNDKDFANINTMLKRAITDNDNFYRVFKSVLTEMGKL